MRVADRRRAEPVLAPGLGKVLIALAGALLVGFAGFGLPGIVGIARAVLDRPAGSVLVPMAGVLDQLSLGLLEAFGLPLAGLGHRALGLRERFVGGRRLRGRTPADRGRLSRGLVGFFSGWIWTRHSAGLPAPSRSYAQPQAYAHRICMRSVACES